MIKNYNVDDINKLNFNDKEVNKFIESKDPFIKNYIYYKNNEAIGFISYSIIYERVELNYIMTKCNYRNQGIAKELMDYMIDECNGKKSITLEVRKDNLIAISLYNKYNFVQTAIRAQYYGNCDGILMERVLVER